MSRHNDLPAKEKLRKGFLFLPQSSRSFWVESPLFWFHTPQTQSRSRRFLGALRRSSLVGTQSYYRWQTRRLLGRKNTSLTKDGEECIKKSRILETSLWKYLFQQLFCLGDFSSSIFFGSLSPIWVKFWICTYNFGLKM